VPKKLENKSSKRTLDMEEEKGKASSGDEENKSIEFRIR